LWELNQDVDLVEKLFHQNLTSLDWELYHSRRGLIRQIPKRLLALTGEAYGTGSIKVLTPALSLPTQQSGIVLRLKGEGANSVETSTSSVMHWLGFGERDAAGPSLVEMLGAFEAFYMAATKRNEAL